MMSMDIARNCLTSASHSRARPARRGRRQLSNLAAFHRIMFAGSWGVLMYPRLLPKDDGGRCAG